MTYASFSQNSQFGKILNTPLERSQKIMLLMKKWLDMSQGLSSYGGFSFEKRHFSEANISRSKADFDPRLPPMENMDLLLAVYTHFRGVTDQRMAHKSPLK
jgi:hypothetical protein